mgnify:CR=1 FL=1
MVRGEALAQGQKEERTRVDVENITQCRRSGQCASASGDSVPQWIATCVVCAIAVPPFRV